MAMKYVRMRVLRLRLLEGISDSLPDRRAHRATRHSQACCVVIVYLQDVFRVVIAFNLNRRMPWLGVHSWRHGDPEDCYEIVRFERYWKEGFMFDGHWLWLVVVLQEGTLMGHTISLEGGGILAANCQGRVKFDQSYKLRLSMSLLFELP